MPRRVSVGASAGAVAVAVIFVLQASIDWLWESTAVCALFLTVVCAAGARVSHRNADARHAKYEDAVPTRMARSRRLRARGVRVLVVAAALAGTAVEVPGMVSSAEVARRQAAQRHGRAAQALAWANGAISAENWSASAFEQRALIEEGAGRLTASEIDLKRSIALAPSNSRHRPLLARVDAERGHPEAAVRDYERARSLRPASVL